MKILKKLLPIAVISMATMNANAAFVVKSSNVPATEMTTNAATNVASNSTINMNELKQLESAQTMQTTKATKGEQIPKILYVLLALLGLGWLGMLINDNFEFNDYDWLISFVLYLLFFLPGLIYTLVKMKKYYGGGK